MDVASTEAPHLEDTILQTDLGKVAAFHIAKMGKIADPALALQCLLEEMGELDGAIAGGGCGIPECCGKDVIRPEEIIKEMCDVYYTILGYCLSRGWDFTGAFKAVHESNMGKVFTAEGKVQKGPGYAPPDMTKYV